MKKLQKFAVLTLLLFAYLSLSAQKADDYRAAANRGDKVAQYNLGACFNYGYGVTKDYTQAVYWYAKAANQGLVEAQFNLGICYYEGGYGVSKDYKQAVYWFTKASNQGYVDAQGMLGVCYYNGGYGVSQDYIQAIYWFTKSANQGDELSQANLGLCYAYGYGVAQDYKQAVYWFTKAANQGNAQAQYNLGGCYGNGNGVQQDHNQAVYWYRKSANQGYAKAQMSLGSCYYYGEGLAKDYKQAAFWFNKVINNPQAGEMEKGLSNALLKRMGSEESNKSNNQNDDEDDDWWSYYYDDDDWWDYYDYEDLSKTSKNESLTFTVNGVSFVMKYVEGGSFQMGATPEQGYDIRSYEQPVHNVTLNSYYMGETEITQSLWKAVMGSNPSEFKGDNLPVECVSWYDCQSFIKELNRLTGKNFRLPTEAEWEFAARGGNISKKYKYSGSNEPEDVAFYCENSWEKGEGSFDYGTHYVKAKQPNELGIYFMSGNVSEWCNDWFDKNYYSNSSSQNPQGPSYGQERVCRGGDWVNRVFACRLSFRVMRHPSETGSVVGFRLALSK